MKRIGDVQTGTLDWRFDNLCQQRSRLRHIAQPKVRDRPVVSHLNRLHIRSLMVEGGATVISNFLAGHLVDRLVVTIAPILMGGLNAVAGLGQLNGHVMPRLSQPRYQALGKDMIMFGELEWESS